MNTVQEEFNNKQELRNLILNRIKARNDQYWWKSSSALPEYSNYGTSSDGEGYIKVKVFDLLPQVGGSKRRSKSKKRKSKKSKKRKSKKSTYAEYVRKSYEGQAGADKLAREMKGIFNITQDTNSYWYHMNAARKARKSSFEFNGKIYYGTPHPKIGMIYKPE